MIVRAHEAKQRIVQSRLLQIQEDRINAIQRSEPAFRQTARRFSRRFRDCGNAELKLLFTAAFEDAKDVARLCDWKLRKRFKKREHAVRPGFFRVWNVGIEKFERF